MESSDVPSQNEKRIYSQTTILEGHYTGQNLFIQNLYVDEKSCILYIEVNGDPTTRTIKSSSFEINFKEFNLGIGDPIYIKIEHRMDCQPNILNPEVLK